MEMQILDDCSIFMPKRKTKLTVFLIFLSSSFGVQDDDAKVKRAFQTLMIYVGNVSKNPDVEKFRKIRIANPLFQVTNLL